MDALPRATVATVAALMGQPARAAMLGALLSGQWLTATELARLAGVAPATASEHLAALVDAGLVRRRRSGRHRYHALASSEVAEALESLERLASPAPSERPRAEAEVALRFARTCYDHLAGTLGVQLSDALVRRGLVSATGSEVTPAGEAGLLELGIDVDELRKGRRTLVRFCLDWSERRDHLAGALGAALMDALIERGWIVRLEGTRAVRLTLRGRERLDRLLGVDLEDTGPASR